MLQTTSSSEPYLLMSRNLIGKVRPERDLEMLLLFHSIKAGHAINSLLGIFQTTSSNLYILFSRNLMACIMQPGDSEKMVKKLTDIFWFYKQHLFQPTYSIEQKLGGMRQILGRLRITKITPCAHKRWPCTRQ